MEEGSLIMHGLLLISYDLVISPPWMELGFGLSFCLWCLSIVSSKVDNVARMKM